MNLTLFSCSVCLVLLCACLPQGQEEIVTFLLKFFLVFPLIFSFTVHMGLSFYTVGSMGWLIWFHVQKPHELWFSFVNSTDWFSTIYWNRFFYLNCYFHSTLHYDIKKNHTHTHWKKKNPNSFMYQVSIFGFSFVPSAHLSVLTTFS